MEKIIAVVREIGNLAEAFEAYPRGAWRVLQLTALVGLLGLMAVYLYAAI